MQWHQFNASYTNSLTTTDWQDFKAEVEYAFKYVDKKLKLCSCQMHRVAEYTKTIHIIVLQLGNHALDNKSQVF